MKTFLRFSFLGLLVLLWTSSFDYSHAACTDLSNRLMVGSRDPQVFPLQAFLISRPESLWSASVPAPTGYFGRLTEQAVKNFQAANGIVNSGGPLTTGYGSVGPRTRAKIKELSCSNTPAQSFAPANNNTNNSYTPPVTQNVPQNTASNQTTPTPTAPTNQFSTNGLTPSPAGTTISNVGGVSFESYTKPGITTTFSLNWPIAGGAPQTVYGGYQITPNLIIPGAPAVNTAIYLVGPTTYQLKAPARHLQLRYNIPTSLPTGTYKLRYEVFDSANALIAIREGGPLVVVQDSDIASIANSNTQFVIEPTGALWVYNNLGSAINVYNDISKTKLLAIANAGIGISVDAPISGGTVPFGQNYELRWHAIGFTIDTITIDATDLGDLRQGAILFNAANTNSFMWDTVSYKQFCKTMTFDVGHRYRLDFAAKALPESGIKSVWVKSGPFTLSAI